MRYTGRGELTGYIRIGWLWRRCGEGRTPGRATRGDGSEMRRKILVTVQALVLAAHLGSPLAAAEPSAEQLAALAGYLEANDVRGLRDYLSLYPDLAEGDTTLAVLLRRFLVESAVASRFFRFQPNLSDSLSGAVGAPSSGQAQAPNQPQY